MDYKSHSDRSFKFLDELYTVHTLKNNLLEIKPLETCDCLNFLLPLISLHPCLSGFLFLFTFQSPTPLSFFLMWMSSYLSSPNSPSFSFFLCQRGYFCVPVLPPLNLNHLPSPLPICPVTFGQGWPPGVQLLPLSMSANQTQPCFERACLSVRNCCWRPLVGHTHCCPNDLWPLVQWLHPVWPHPNPCAALWQNITPVSA